MDNEEQRLIMRPPIVRSSIRPPVADPLAGLNRRARQAYHSEIRRGATTEAAMKAARLTLPRR